MDTKPRILTPSFVLLFAISLAVCIAMNMLNVVIPLYVTQNLQGGTTAAGFMATAYTVASCLSRPVNGVLTDRFGRRRMMCAGAIIFGAACLLCGLIPVLAAAFILRMCMGVGYSAASTANNTASTDVIPSERMSEGIAYFGISLSLASALGPSIAAFLTDSLGNTGSLYVTAALCALAFVLALPLRYEKKHPIPKNPGKKAGFAFDRTAALPSVLQGLSLFLLSSVMCFMTLYIVSLGFPSAVAGTFFLISSLVVVVVRLAGARFVALVPRAVFLVPAWLCLAAMMLLVPHASTPMHFYGCALLYGLGHGVVWMTLGAEAVRRALPERRGAANATFYFAYDAAIGIGAAVWGVFIDSIGYAACYRIAAIAFVVLAASGFVLYHRQDAQ